MTIEILPLTNDLIPFYVDHLHQHMSESGVDNIIYSPFAIGFQHDKREMEKSIRDRFTKTLDQLNWQRAFVVKVKDRIVGHLDLQGANFEASRHRIKLGMGLDREMRGQGLGSQLMQSALEWSREHTQADWIDLYVFEHNTPVRSLYKKFGFKEIGMVVDLFRVSGEKINDIRMSLKINRS